MPFGPGSIATFSFDGLDISEFVEMVTPKQKRDDMKLPRIGGKSVARLVGPVTTDLEVSGWFHETVDAKFKVSMDEITPTAKAVAWDPHGAAGPSSQARAGIGFLVDYSPDTDASKPGSWKATISIDGNWT